MCHGTTRFLALCVVATAAWPKAGLAEPERLPDSRLGVRSAPLLLLTRRDVQKDLKLTAEQIENAQRVIAALREQAKTLKGLQGSAAVAARRRVDEQSEQWIVSNLSEEQRERLGQIDLQWEGPGALSSRVAVADRLDLTADQRARVKAAVEEANRLRAAGKFQWGDENTLTRKVLETLTEPQRARWKTMMGRPFRPEPEAPAAAGARR